MFCLRRYDKSAKLPWLFAAYTEQVTSVPFELNGKVAATLFVRDINTKNRATKLGWIDETDQYNLQVEAQKLKESKKEAVVESFSSTQKETKVKRKTRKK